MSIDFELNEFKVLVPHYTIYDFNDLIDESSEDSY